MPKFCSKCGGKLDQDSTFCMMCGAKIEERLKPSVEEKKTKSKPVKDKPVKPKPAAPTSEQPATNVNIAMQQQSAQSQMQKQTKKSHIGLIIAIVSIVVAVVVIAVVLFFVLQGSGGNGNNGDGGVSDMSKFYGTWETSLAIPFTLNQDTTWDMEIPFFGPTQVGYWTIKDNKIHLTASISEEWNYLSGAYTYNFINDNTCTLTSTATSYFVITLTR